MPAGGRRPGAGRPKGRVKAPTQPLRVPCSRVDDIKRWLQQPPASALRLPLYSSQVQAGFPSPVDDGIEVHLDLNDYLIKHPAATFLVRATGLSMTGVGIFPGDILVVDRSLEPVHHSVIIVALDGELTVKRLYQRSGTVKLQPENPDFPEIDISNREAVHIWGVVTNVIHPL